MLRWSFAFVLTFMFSGPGRSQELLYKYGCINSLRHPFPPLHLLHCHPQTVGYGVSSHIVDYVLYFLVIPNPNRHQNHLTGSKVIAILLIWWIWPVSGFALGRVCAQPAKQACFHQLGPLGRVGHKVAMSVCMYLCVYVCHKSCNC